jgi:ubiquinone/menaquinone biosynthesis C-methylase UbiE
MSYLKTTNDFYKKAAETPDVGLCCTTSPVWLFPGLNIPKKMLEMNYGCGATVHHRDLTSNPTVLYVGVGGGMELLQFSYFSRKPGGVIGVDTVPEMLSASRENFIEAEKSNDWFRNEYVRLVEGDALNLPIEDGSVDVAAQNCLFNIFKLDDLNSALAEMYRVLKPHGRLVMSDPITPEVLPDSLKDDETLRAMCVSGTQTYDSYIGALVGAGFGTIEIRAKRPYRLLDPQRYESLKHPVLLESLEIAAIKDPVLPDGACVFTGKAAIYFGADDNFDDGAGHIMQRDMPLSICDKTAAKLEALNRNDIMVTPSTFFYDGGGCC